MSENYAKDILARLEEIEKLQKKLRSLVPRVTNYKCEEGSLNDSLKTSADREKAYTDSLNACGTEDDRKTRKSMIVAQWQKLKKRLIESLVEIWREKNSMIRNLLFEDESDITVVNTFAQTSDNELREISSKEASLHADQETRSSGRKYVSEKRRLAMREFFQRLLEHFNYSVENEDRIVVPDHYLGERVPHRAQILLLSPNDDAATLKVLSSARKVCIEDGPLDFSIFEFTKHRVSRLNKLLERRLLGKYTLEKIY